MKMREAVATALVTQLAAVTRLAAQPTVIDAPPSKPGEYPGLAIWIERTKLHITQDYDVLESNGVPLIGANATETVGNQLTIPDGQPFMLDANTTLSHVGTYRCRGRLWAGSRYPAKREELEESVVLQFFTNRNAPGRIDVQLAGIAEVGGYRIPFGVGVADISDTEWSSEHTFEARLWSWMVVTIDMPILIPRHDPLATQMFLTLSTSAADFDNITVSVPTDVTKLQGGRAFTVTPTSPNPPTPTAAGDQLAGIVINRNP